MKEFPIWVKSYNAFNIEGRGEIILEFNPQVDEDAQTWSCFDMYESLGFDMYEEDEDGTEINVLVKVGEYSDDDVSCDIFYVITGEWYEYNEVLQPKKGIKEVHSIVMKERPYAFEGVSGIPLFINTSDNTNINKFGIMEPGVRAAKNGWTKTIDLSKSNPEVELFILRSLYKKF